ncbi:SPOR domain-containing protein [Halorhodospira halophila]|uniref:Sporulation domain protein n=1 Tax=Halorhodospira halophila (strain DSM 244 / SL1) TaxID=349124 RepID=A1WZR6_HALHL|nr:SPOR domain-containing protein [Halorhodospira halophila]ABM63178.1 Sporulation domain protein [Halorhodospira halophila SL1]MBK1729357.1 hypothetical protein [Halorhodospira halophila]
MAQKSTKPRGNTRSKARTPARSRGGGAQARRTERRAVPGFVWLLIGGVIGAVALLFVQYQQGREDAAPVDPAAEMEPEPEDEPAAEESERSYDFYELLMQDEVTVPEEDLGRADERRTQDEEEDEISRAATFEEGRSYLLQAGSFQRHDDAESMRATLALVGLPAQIHTVELDEGEEWHRVRVGPFEDSDRLEEARTRMEDNDIQPLMLRQDG